MTKDATRIGGKSVVSKTDKTPKSPSKKKENAWVDFRKFLYDREHKKVLGRTGKEWLRVTIFYVVFYIFLFGFTIGLILMVRDRFINDSYPNYFGPGTILGGEPRLIVRAPGVKYRSNIKLEFRVQNTAYVKDMRNLFEEYNNALTSTKLEDCTKSTTPRTKPCMVNLTDVQEYGTSCTCQKGQICQFGYDSGDPCFVLTISKILRWEPKVNRSNNCWQDRIHMNCTEVLTKGNQPTSISAIEWYPKTGIPSCYFPYKGKQLDDGYMDPLFLVKVNITKPNPFTKVSVTIHCNVVGNPGTIKIHVTVEKP